MCQNEEMQGPSRSGADGYVLLVKGSEIAKKYHWKDRTFEAEVKALQTVKSPWIVGLAAAFKETRCCWLELFDVDLMQVLLGSDAQDDAFERDVASSLLGALEACHGADIVHRDVKPENVLVRNCPRRIVLCDFGRSVFLRESQEVARVEELQIPFSGTYSYAAPEALEGRCRTSNDCWAAGVVIYAALERQMPFDETSDEERKRLPRCPDLEKTRPWPSWGEPVLRGLFQRRPQNRWTAVQARVVLESA
jgi:serine/threonine protein kinase